MTIPQILLNEARERWGLRVTRRDDRIIFNPRGRCPQDLKNLFRDYKPEIMRLLEDEQAMLGPDCAPWLHVARQVLEGEFDSADGSTRESVTIGLRSIAHPDCQSALKRLAAKEQER
jgi:hypothetical protein